MTSNWASEDIPAPPQPSARRQRQAPWLTWLILAAIVLLGASFSTLNLYGWDDDTGQHPDERFMTDVASSLKMPTSLSEYLDSTRNPLNPRNTGHPFYVYGLLPQTLTHVSAVALTPYEALPTAVRAPSATSWDTAPQVPNPDLRGPRVTFLQELINPAGRDLTSYYFVHKVGRSWSALFEILSTVVVFLIGWRLYGQRVGLLAALFMALSALPIQLAHFFTVDSATAFFTLLAIYWAVRVAQGGGIGSFTALGLSIGAAMACRVTMAALGILAVVAVAQRIWRVGQWASGQAGEQEPHNFTPSPLHPLAGFGLLALAGALSILTFRMLQPDAFMGTSFFDLRPDPRFIENIQAVGEQVSGAQDFPPSQQWAGRTPYLFPLQNMILWGMGLPLGLAAWIAWAIAGIQMARAAWAGWNGGGWSLLRRRLVHLLPWSWIGFYFAWQGGQFGMTMRYYLLLYGLLGLFAAWGLAELARRRPTVDLPFWSYVSRRWTYIAGRVLLAIVVLGTVCWAYAFTRIYTRPHSRITASRWIYANIPAGSKLTSEEWDDFLPVNIDGNDAGSRYIGIKTYPYAEDDESKYTGYTDKDGKHVDGLFEQLDKADYVILSSNRVYGSATRMPMRYPALTRYYYYLFNGQLGFEQVADITSYPTLFGIPIPDQGAEEAWSVYDHPRVLIFKKTAAYSHARAAQLITGNIAWNEVYKLKTSLASRVPAALRLTESQWPAYRAAGTWATLFDPASLANRAPWLAWLLALELIGLAIAPLLFRMLPGLPDRGFALAKTLALLLVAYSAWLLGSFDVIAFTPGSVWLCAGVLIVAGGLVGWRGRAELLAFARRRRAALLAAEGLFLLAFLGFVLIRALNPDLWHPARGGEKPMDLAFLTAVLKSGAFPAYDPWFAGGYINYYYFGFVFVGALVHLTGITPTTAYNLAVPTLFALTALGAWGVAYNLVGVGSWGLGVGDSQPPTPNSQLPRRERRAIVTGIVAAVFVVLLGPLSQAVWYLPGSATPPFAGLPAECLEKRSYAEQQQCRGRDEWAFWDATRLVGMDVQDSTITEFPFFTFLFADLHAHMIALPLTLAALGLTVALVKAKGKRQNVKDDLLPFTFCLLPLSLVVGALRATNTWDFPTYLGLSVLTLALIAWRQVRRGAGWPQATLFWALSSLLLLLGSTLLFLPFTRSFATDYAGFQLWKGDRTPAIDFLKIDGLWLFLLGSATLLLYRRAHAVGARTLALIGGGALALALLAAVFEATALVLLVPFVGVAIGMFVDLLLGSPRRPADAERVAVYDEGQDKAVAGVALLGDTRPAAGLTTLLPILWALIALLIGLAAEVLVAKGDIGRMNTVFKFGMQSWVLLALSSAVALTALWPATRAKASRPYGWAWRGVCLLLLLAALVYPLTATPARIADRIDTSIGPTLDGIAFMRSEKGSWGENNQTFTFVQDAAALDWMRTHIDGTPIVLEAQTEAYRWGGRVSIYTGLPTLLGWPWHETQQRSVAEVAPVLASRQNLIQQLYSTPDQRMALDQLRLYGVEYVYVGQLERALYESAGLAKFDALAQSGQIEQAYAAGDTRIYRVPRAADAPPPAVLTTSLPVRAPTLPPERTLLLDKPVYKLPAVGDYAWNRLADSQPVAVLLWLLACYALLALGLPPAVLVFGGGRNPDPSTSSGGAGGRGSKGDGGYAWARLIGLLLLGYAVWLPVSARLWSSTRWAVLLGALLVLALDAAIIAWLGQTTNDPFDYAQGRQRPTTNHELPAEDADVSSIVDRRSSFVRGLKVLRDHFATHGRAIMISEALFLGAFALMTTLRAFNPDLWQPIFGGEKPFEFAFFNAIVRSPVMPPYDPFFSDGIINYYYYGLFLTSLPVKATGIAPAVAFNLIVPTLFAFTLVGAVALVVRLSGRLWAGLAGGAFVALLGNLAAAFPVGDGQGLAPVIQALRGGSLATFGDRLGAWFWGPSRVISIPDKLITINEFPFWSYLFADLHPHLIAMPVTILVAALAYELFDQRPTTNDRPSTTAIADPRWSFVTVGCWLLAALALGALAVTNSWDFPTYALLIGGALLGRAWRDPGASKGRRVAAMAGAVAIAGGVILAALLLYLPFFQNFERPAGVSGIGLVRDGTWLGAYLLIYGLFLAVLAIWIFGVAARLARSNGRRLRVPLAALPEEESVGGSAVLGIVARPPALAGTWKIVRLMLLSTLLLVLIVGALQPQLARDLAQRLWESRILLKAGLLILTVVGAAVLLSRRLPAAVWFAAWLAVIAWAISFGIELFYIRDHLDGSPAYRMNTVFKFGLQAWILMALASAAALPWLARGLRRAGALAQGLVWPLLAALVALALIFPLAGTPSRLANRFAVKPGLTLDGLAFMDLATYDWQGTTIDLSADAEAIRWLNEHISGSPVVLQSSLEFYRAYGVRVAANTGLPTIVSPLHASEQHDPEQVYDRDRDVQLIYSSLDQGEVLRLLSKYHVGYVVVGPIERAAYGEPGVSKFDQMVGPYLSVAYQNKAVKIFQVNDAVYTFVAAPQPTPQPAPQPQPQPQPVLQPGVPTLEALEKQVADSPTAAGPAFDLAQRYRDAGNFDKAVAAIEPAARAHPNDVALNQLWGDILRDAGRVDQAKAAYRAAIAADPSAGNYNKLGVELIKWGELDQAAEAFNQAIAADANVADPYYHLGEVYEQQGQANQAIEQYRAYLNIAVPNAPFYADAKAALERLKSP